MMTSLLFLLSFTDALRLKQTRTVDNFDNMHCGIVLGAFSKEKFVISQTKFALSIARLTMPANWCPESPDLKYVPVVIYSDVADASSIAASVPTKGVEPNFKVVDMGTLENPKPPFTAFPKGIKGGYTISEKHQPFWGWRPQMLKFSPFNRTITLDDDASPCSGQGLTDLFGVLKKFNVDYSSPQWRHYSGLFNHGIMVMNRDAVKPWLDKWEDIQNNALGSCDGFAGDQGSGNLAWGATPKSVVSRQTCPESLCCAHYTALPKCSVATCLVHHEHARGPFDEEQIINNERLGHTAIHAPKDDEKALTKDAESITDNIMDASPKPGNACR